MALVQSSGPPFVPPPADLTLPEVFLDRKLKHSTTTQEYPQIPTLIDAESGRTVFLSELRNRTDCLARSFAKQFGLVSLLAANHTDYPVCIWAAHRLGAIVAPTSPGLTTGYQFEVTKPSIIIADAENVSIAAQAAKRHNISRSRIIVLGGDPTGEATAYESVNVLINHGRHLPNIHTFRLEPGAGSSKVAFLCFSSGTTGKPKAVSISHQTAICNVLQLATFDGLNMNLPGVEPRYRPGDVCTGGIVHEDIYGLAMNLHFILYCQMTLVITRKFDFLKFLEGIKKYRITHLMIVPPQVILLCKHPAALKADLSGIRYCMVAAAPLTIELTQHLIKKLPNACLGQGYGMTEMCGAVSMWPLSQRIGTVGSGGQLISGTTAKVVKSDGSIAAIGESGELWVKGNQITLGYYKNEASTREAFQNGWYKTGDEVKIDSNGDLFIIDRIKEMIKVKGFQVAPAELEGHLIDHPSIAEVGVIGVPDEYAGELPLAFIVLRQQAAEEIKNNPAAASSLKADIYKFVKNAKSRYKWLDGGIEFVDSIPKSPSGKILRRILRDSIVNKTRTPHVKPKL
ncbi:4-coumarate--CoA ligase-like 1 [Psilocybe cubensis]|uniref:4-coumarate--CoA ligase-like 1 n=1 Tax=Psilocybe cubensis TaxID=181762 RepID=A0ACB8GTH4_PSICU|nr:4-coumarate--CoA ligase-like 1 [Psilocybe cubensis]KAH9478770.1 4-coumarate--CoA ligase-like 1 [Psilocybe cubensis]